MNDEKMDECIMKVAQAAIPANVLTIITKLTKLEEKIDRNHETINAKLDRLIRLAGVNET